MALPANLSPSPFQEVFSELFERRSVAEAVQRRLGLNDAATAAADDDFGMLRTADEHVIGWTLSRHDDASRYVRLLLQSISRLLDNFEKQKQESNGRRTAPAPAAVGGIDATPLSLEEALPWLTGGGGAPATRNDPGGAAAAPNTRKSAQLMDVALLHYAVARLCEIVRALQDLSANRKKRPTTTTTTTTNGGGGGTDERRRRNGTTNLITKGASEARSGATMSTTFYPDGVLLPDWQPLMSLLSSPAIDSFVQRT
jgi:hypothetical protein